MNKYCSALFGITILSFSQAFAADPKPESHSVEYSNAKELLATSNTSGVFKGTQDCYSLRITKNKETGKFRKEVMPLGKIKMTETISSDGLSIVATSDDVYGSSVEQSKIEFIDDMTVKYTTNSTQISKDDPSAAPVQSTMVRVKKLIDGQLVTQSLVIDGKDMPISLLSVTINLDKDGNRSAFFSQRAIKQVEGSSNENIASYSYCSLISKKQVQ